MCATMDSGKVLFTLIYAVFSCFSFSLIGCGTDSEIQELRSALERAEKSEAEMAEELERLKKEWRRPLSGSGQKRVAELKKRVAELEKLVEKLPQATIEGIRIDQKKKNIDISVTFNIKNRKGIKCFVNGYFFQRRHSSEKFKELQDKKGSPISISEEFTPKRVIETRTVKFSISHAELNVSQARELRFDSHIYDKPTNSFLNTQPYSKSFRYDPFAD